MERTIQFYSKIAAFQFFCVVYCTVLVLHILFDLKAFKIMDVSAGLWMLVLAW